MFINKFSFLDKSNDLQFPQQIVQFNFVFWVNDFQEQQFWKCLLGKYEIMVRPHIHQWSNAIYRIFLVYQEQPEPLLQEKNA